MSTTAKDDLDAAEMHLLNAKLDMRRRAVRREFTRAEVDALDNTFRVAADAIRALRLALPTAPVHTKGGA